MLGFRLVRAVTPTALAAAATAFLAGCGAAHQAASATTTRAKPAARAKPRVAAPSTPAQRILGLPPVKPGPVPGYVLIADRNNNRLLIVSPSKHVVWSFPRPGRRPPGPVVPRPGRRVLHARLHAAISINEEFNQTMSLIDAPQAPDRLVVRPSRASRARARATSPTPTTPTCCANGAVHGRRHQELPRPLRQPRRTSVVREIGHAGLLRPRPASRALVPQRRHAAG